MNKVTVTKTCSNCNQYGGLDCPCHKSYSSIRHKEQRDGRGYCDEWRMSSFPGGKWSKDTKVRFIVPMDGKEILGERAFVTRYMGNGYYELYTVPTHKTTYCHENGLKQINW